MATTSEIQVTEAYIGLLGRAPDPDGLAYWVKQYDNAVAAGQDSTFALKKLMNDIAKSPEYKAGTQGTNVPATGNPSKTQAEAIVQDIYNNLFDRNATQADKDYWAPQLTGGSTTAPEMTINLITAAKGNANTTDADVLGFKQQAATYYVDSVKQTDFNKTNAAAAVSAVNGPQTLNDSKTATDALASGTGITYALTAAADTPAMTLGDDTGSGVVGTGATFGDTDSIVDASTIDQDTLTLTGDNGFNSGTVTKVEAINLSLARQNGAAFDINDVSKITGSTINLTVAEKVTIAGIEVDGETEVDLSTGGAANLDALVSNLSTVNVTKLTAKATDTGTVSADIAITGDADLKTLVLSGIDDNDTVITLANNDATLTLDGTTATNDSVSVTGVGKVALNLESSADDDTEIEEVTLAGSGGAVTFTVTNADETTGVTKYTTAGDQAITLKGAAAQFNGAVITQSGTGSLGFNITTAGDLDATGLTLAGGISLAADVGANATDTITAPSGTTVSIDTAQTNSSVLILDGNDAATTSTLVINANQAAGELQTVDYETITINTNDSKAITIDEIDMDANDASVTVGGSNDVTITNAAVAGTDLSVVGKEISLAAATATKGDLSVTASGGAAATGTLTAANDITITATNDVDVAAVTTNGTAGNVSLTGNDVDATGTITVANGTLTLKSTGSDTDIDAVTITKGGMTATSATAFNITGALAATNDVSITATNELSVDAITTTLGGVTLSGNDVSLDGDISAAAGTVTVTATNDAATSDVNAKITASSVQFTSGKFDADDAGDAQLISATGGGGIIISGDAQLAGTTGANLKASSVTITSNSDQKIAELTEAASTQGIVLAAGTSSGDITVSAVDLDATGVATLVTGSGKDSITINDTNVTAAITSGGDIDTITLTAVAATGSSIDAGDGADILSVSGTTSVVVNGGAGDDTLTIGANTVGGTVDMGGGTDDTIVLAAGDYSVSSTPLNMKNVEELDITAGDVTFDWVQLNGNDVAFELKGDNATDELIIEGGATGDTIDLTQITSNALAPASLKVIAGNGTNIITGAESLVNTITGGTGVDTITGGDGADTLNGGTGNDTVNGGNGGDTITGGDGFDVINGGDGTDGITGGAKGDTINGGAGVDTYTTGDTDSNATGAATSVAAAGIDVVTVTNGDKFTFSAGATLNDAGGAGAGSAAVAVGLADNTDDTTFTELLAAMEAAADASTAANDVVLFIVTDSGTGGSNDLDGLYLVRLVDGTISDNDVLIKLVGTGLDANSTVTLNAGDAVITI